MPVGASSGDEREAGAGSLASFDPAERHEVRALQDSRLLLLLTPWPAPDCTRAWTPDREATTLTLFAAIIAFLGLAVAGLFLPLLWIPAAALLVVGLLYLWSLARASGRNAECG